MKIRDSRPDTVTDRRLGDNDRYRKEPPGARQVLADIDLAVLGIDHILVEPLGERILPVALADSWLKQEKEEAGR